MSDITQKDIWALELSNYFIKKHKYQLMTLNKETQEMWLIQPQHATYPIIMISTQKTDEFNHEELRLHRSGLSMLLRSKADGINISVDNESSLRDDLNVVISDEGISNPLLLETFKGLDKLLKPSSNLGMSMNKVASSIQKNMMNIQKRAMIQASLATTILSIIVAIVFGISNYISYKYNMNYVEVLLRMGAYYKPVVVELKQYWRLITPMFLHADFLHIFMNLLALRNVGLILEKEMGALRYLFTLVMGVLFGSMFLFIRNDTSMAVGISAGIYALLGVLLVVFYEKDLFKNKMIRTNVLTTILLNFYISLMPNVSMTGHLGGLYAGVLLGFAFSKRKDWDQIRLYSKIIFVLSFIFLSFLMIQNANVLF